MKSETRSFYETAVRTTVTRIIEELDDALDLAALARTAALSPFHFHRIFRGMLGETPLELHRRLRMERAAHQLATSDASVTRIAFDAGYETHESFTRAFNLHYGASPSAFRRSARASRSECARPPQIELAARSGLHFRAERLPGETVIFKKGESIMQVELKGLPELRVAAVSHKGPYNRIAEAFQRLGEIAGPAGIIRPPATEMLALYYDDPETTPSEELRSDAGLTVPNDVVIPNGMSEIRIGASRYACGTYFGPYTGLGDAWAELMGAWLPGSGHRVGVGPTFEIYRNTPAQVPPEKLCTELYVPIV